MYLDSLKIKPLLTGLVDGDIIPSSISTHVLLYIHIRYGFNSHGHSAVRTRLATWPIKRSKFPGKQLGISLGKNKDTPEAVDDYVKGIRSLGVFADYLVINVSSPNTPGLRNLQAREKLSNLIDAVSICVHNL